MEGGMLHLVIADRVRDAYLGEVTMVLGEHRVGELGCGVVPAARGRGVATEALRLLADWALDTLGLGRLQVFVATENVAALRLAAERGLSARGGAAGVLGRRRRAARRRRPLAAPDRRASAHRLAGCAVYRGAALLMAADLAPPDQAQSFVDVPGHCCILGSCVGSAYMGGQPRSIASGRSS